MCPQPPDRQVSTHHRDDHVVADVLALRHAMRDRPLQLGAAFANTRRILEQAMSDTELARDSDNVQALDYAMQELAASTLLALSNLRAKAGRA